VSLRCPPPGSQCWFVFVCARRELDHPNIVKYLGTESAATTLIIFLEYVSGGSIATMVEKFGALHESVVQRCDPEGPVTVTVVELYVPPAATQSAEVATLLLSRQLRAVPAGLCVSALLHSTLLCCALLYSDH
jgi:hypothetical protein